MKINSAIFKAYDIRGKYPTELNEEVAGRIGYAAARVLKRRYRVARLRVLVCRDVRSSSPLLHRALLEGLLMQGCRVIDAGIGTTPFFYYLVHTMKLDGGIMITASHNPAEYNGFKIRARGGMPVSFGSGLEKIRNSVMRGIPRAQKSQMGGSVSHLGEEVKESYLRFLKKGIVVKKLEGVIDAAGGSTTFFLPKLLNAFPSFLYKPLFFESEGTFKTHPPNPFLPEAQRYIREALRKSHFRFGALFDGDGDRIFFFDEKGNHVRSEYIMGLFARAFLKKYPGSWLVFSANTSRGVREYLEEEGGKVKLSRIGYTFIREAMRRTRAPFGVEISGHFYFKKFFYDDSGFLALLTLASILSRTHVPLSRLVAPFARYLSSGEINFSVRDKKKVMRRIAAHYRRMPGVKLSYLDGITIEFPEWWCNVRPSNTEPFIRLVIEAKTQKLFEDKKGEIIAILKKTVS